MSEIKPCPEIEMVENLRYSWKYGLFKAVDDDKHVSDQAAADMIEALAVSRDRASDACASVQKERDDLREMLGEAREAFARIADPDRFCGVPIDSEACNHFAMHGQEMQEIASAFLARYEGGR